MCKIAQNMLLIKKSQVLVYFLLAILVGAIMGYAVGRIETADLLNAQASRHITEILRVRDEYGDKARDTRDSVKQAAESANEAAQVVKDLVEEIGPSARKQADRATRAAGRAQQAQRQVEEVFPMPPVVNETPVVVPYKKPSGDVPEWLNTP